jgi:hypothetical protein
VVTVHAADSFGPRTSCTARGGPLKRLILPESHHVNVPESAARAKKMADAKSNGQRDRDA